METNSRRYHTALGQLAEAIYQLPEPHRGLMKTALYDVQKALEQGLNQADPFSLGALNLVLRVSLELMKIPENERAFFTGNGATEPIPEYLAGGPGLITITEEKP